MELFRYPFDKSAVDILNRMLLRVHLGDALLQLKGSNDFEEQLLKGSELSTALGRIRHRLTEFGEMNTRTWENGEMPK